MASTATGSAHAGPPTKPAAQRHGQPSATPLLGGLMERLPHAGIAAIAETGLFVPIPDTLAIGHRRVVSARWALDLVAAADASRVASAWERTMADGYAVARVDSADGSPLTIHFVDAVADHGVYVGIFDGDTLPSDADALVPLRPRLGHVEKDRLANILSADDAILQMLGFERDELVGHRALDFIHPDDQGRAITSWLDLLSGFGRERRVRLRHRRGDGTWLWVEIANEWRLDDGELPHLHAEMLDISDEMAAHEAVRAREQLLKRLAEAMPIGILQVGPGLRVDYTNSRLAEIFGAAVDAGVADYLAAIDAHHRDALDAAIADALAHGRDAELDVTLTRRGAMARSANVKVRALAGEGGAPGGALVCVEDTTLRAELESELRRRAAYDQLTGCLNRAATIQELESFLRTAPAGGGTAVAFVDLDRFKEVNDTWGHTTGDELLAIAARRLADAAGECGTVGRIGGDEFVVICRVPPDKAAAGTAELAARIARAVEGPVVTGGERIPLRASVGVAFAPAGTHTADSMLADADDAMYEVKRTRLPGHAEVARTRRRPRHPRQT